MPNKRPNRPPTRPLPASIFQRIPQWRTNHDRDLLPRQTRQRRQRRDLHAGEQSGLCNNIHRPHIRVRGRIARERVEFAELEHLVAGDGDGGVGVDGEEEELRAVAGEGGGDGEVEDCHAGGRDGDGD